MPAERAGWGVAKLSWPTGALLCFWPDGGLLRTGCWLLGAASLSSVYP